MRLWSATMDPLTPHDAESLSAPGDISSQNFKLQGFPFVTSNKSIAHIPQAQSPNFPPRSLHGTTVSPHKSLRPSIRFDIYEGDVEEDVLDHCASLFSQHYAVWSDKAKNYLVGKCVKARVKMTSKFMKRIYLVDGFVLGVKLDQENSVIAHAIGIVKNDEEMNGRVMWHRHKGIAKSILTELIKAKSPKVVGIASSHPHGIIALQRATGSNVDLGFVQEYVARALTLCNVEYLTGKNLVGSAFHDEDDPKEAISLVNTEFYIDHTEPLLALKNLRDNIQWPLGKLLEGHEFIVVFKVLYG